MPKPIIFGNRDLQELLVDIYENGPIRIKRGGVSKKLVGSGVARIVRHGRKRCYALDHRHPAYEHIVSVLRDLSGKPVNQRKYNELSDPAVHSIDPRYPLMHHGSTVNFRTILYAALAGPAGIPIEKLRLLMPDQWPNGVSGAADRLANDGVLISDGSTIRLSAALPPAFKSLVTEIGRNLAVSDMRFSERRAAVTKRVAAHVRATDNAPRIFGPDSRLRNLMTLAKYGPLHLDDLRRVVGGDQIQLECADNAAFGRAGVAVVWDTDIGPAAAINPAFPLNAQLTVLLRKLEERYPLSPLVRRHPAPLPPAVHSWNGDKLSLFGSPIPTAILLSIGANGWTFEAICVAVCTGYHRENVKSALHRLEDEGVLESDRKRGPGYGPRVVRISQQFVARDELVALLEAAVRTWPEFRGRTNQALRASLTPKMMTHLRNRGLV